jgi:hypothetical protein
MTAIHPCGIKKVTKGRLLRSPLSHPTEVKSRQTLPTAASDRVPITPVQCHQQLLATVRVRQTYIRLHRLTSPSHRSQVRRRRSALPHMSRPHSTIVVVLPPPRHTLQRLRPLIYHHLDIHRLARGTRRHHHHSHQHPHAIRHSRRLSAPPLRDIPLRAPHSVQHLRAVSTICSELSHCLT